MGTTSLAAGLRLWLLIGAVGVGVVGVTLPSIGCDDAAEGDDDDDDDDDDDNDDDASDELVGDEGDSCDDEQFMRCAEDSNDILKCVDGKLVNIGKCPGGASCERRPSGAIQCGGTLVAEAGSYCTDEGVQACSFDRSTVQRCVQGEWVTAINCPPSSCENKPNPGNSTPGPGECYGHWCGNCGYTIGDMCSFSAGGVLCSTDNKSIIQCSSGVVTEVENCGGGQCVLVPQGGFLVRVCQ